MSFSRTHKLIAYASAALGFLALSLGPYLETAAAAVLAVLFVSSVFVEGERVKSPGWARAWTVGVIALLLVQILRGMLGGSLMSLILEFAAGLQVSRLFNRRGAREYQQIGAISLLHLIVGTVLSTELSYGLLFIGFVIVTPWMLTLSHLRSEIEAQQAARASENAERDVARVLASKRLVGARFFFSTAALSLPLFAMTGVVFFLFPRVGLGFLSFERGFGQPVSGFGGNVELGDFGVIRADPTVVLRVIPPDLPENPPEYRSIRMRGTSFDHYDGRRWLRSRDVLGRSVGHFEAFYPIPLRPPLPTQDQPWQVILDPLEEPVIFIPPRTVGLEVPARIIGGLPTGRDLEVATGMDIRYADADALGLRYTAWTSDSPYDVATDPLEPGLAERYLQVPSGHERVAALAREWTAGVTSDEARVQVLLTRLATFRYSLSMPTVGDRVPLNVFLFEARYGHCEYFSTAMAIMLRSLGIPARNVTGFLGGRYNSYGGYYELSQGDAHSWVEAFLPGQGWVTVEPTPSARDEIAPEPGWFGGLRQMLDAIKTRWAEDVVGYDLRRQFTLASSLREWLRGTQTAPPATQDGDETSFETSTHRIPGIVWVLLGLALLVVGYLIARRRRKERRPPLDPATQAAVDLYRLLDRTLAEKGRPRPESCAPLERLEQLEREGFAELDLARDVTDRYLSVRYGRRPASPAELEALRGRVRALAKRRDLFGMHH